VAEPARAPRGVHDPRGVDRIGSDARGEAPGRLAALRDPALPQRIAFAVAGRAERGCALPPRL